MSRMMMSSVGPRFMGTLSERERVTGYSGRASRPAARPQRLGQQLDVVERPHVERARAQRPGSGSRRRASTQSATCSRICSGVPTRRPSRHSSRVMPSRTPGGLCSAQAFEAAGQVGFVLAAQARRARASARPWPGRGRRRRTPRSSTSRRSRYCVGGPRPSTCSSRRRSSTAVRSTRSPLPPTNTGGRGTCSAGGSTTASCARWYLPSKVSGSPPSRPPTMSSASRSRSMRSPGDGHRHADGLVVGLVPPGAEADVEATVR